MSILFKDAVQEQLPATDTTVYTCPTNAVSAQVQFGNCTNEDAVDTTLVVNVVKSGGAVGVTNVYIPSTTITAGTNNSLSSIINMTLMPGDFISAIAGSAAKLNFKLSIKEIYA